jgi:hypothetical protein
MPSLRPWQVKFKMTEKFQFPTSDDSPKQFVPRSFYGVQLRREQKLAQKNNDSSEFRSAEGVCGGLGQ